MLGTENVPPADLADQFSVLQDRQPPVIGVEKHPSDLEKVRRLIDQSATVRVHERVHSGGRYLLVGRVDQKLHDVAFGEDSQKFPILVDDGSPRETMLEEHRDSFRWRRFRGSE